jgi:hypothetical protein
VTVAGTDYTPTTLKAKLQSEIDAVNALDALKAQCKQSVATTKGVRMQMRSFRASLKKFILGTFGQNAVQVLEDFGMSVPKNLGPRTAEAKAESQKKAKATRAAKKKALEGVASASAAAQAAAVGVTPSKA